MEEPVHVDDSDTECTVGLLSKNNCVICLTPLGDNSVKVYEKGLKALIEVSLLRNDLDLHNYLTAASIGDVYIHKNCRKKYTDKRTAFRTDEENQVQEPSAKKLRSTLPQFNYKTQCFFCGKSAINDSKHPNRDAVVEVRTMKTRYTLMEYCDKLGEVADDVRIRLNDCIDMVAAEARYHNDCYKAFSGSRIGSNKPHRPVAHDMNERFDDLCHWLENDGDAELYTLSDLHAKMHELANGEEVYGEKYLRTKLKDRYGSHVFFAHLGGSRKDVVCFKDMASYIVSDEWYRQRAYDSKEESERIMITAAKLVREEIRARGYNKDVYPRINEIKFSEGFVTPSLHLFLNTLIKDELKRDAIGQAITQSARPKSVISPLLFGIGIELHHVFGSKWLIEELSSMGFSITYNEVQLFKQSILQQQTLQTLSPPPFPTLGQYIADNADSNIRTLDGRGTFHGMGVVSWYQRQNSHQITGEGVKRMQRVNVSELTYDKGIPIINYKTPTIPALSTFKFNPIRETQLPFTIPPVYYYSTLLWSSAKIFSTKHSPSPDWTNWSGFMHCVYKNDRDSISADEVLILPIIDLNPSDETCIYSTLSYIQDQVLKLKLPSTSVTFDQPLFIKAVEIATSKKLNKLVIRLGGFHTLMSAIGSVFHTMRGSGIEEALGQIFGPNVIVHILSGKAIARALRALYLLDACLSTKLLEMIAPSNLLHSDNDIDDDEVSVSNESTMANQLTKAEVQTLQNLLDCVLNSESETLCEDIISSETLGLLDKHIKELKISLSSQSRTAKLWIQLLNYIRKLENFVACERLKDWNGHLRACTELLNLFAATGHIHYAKSARLYVQNMTQLPEQHPWLYQRYTEGAHAVERTEHCFNGLWSDLVIEQTLMCSLKSRGGLTHGRGLTESVRHQWVFTLPICAAIHEAMTSRSHKKIRTSEQHVDLTSARKDRDISDLNKLLEWFDDHNPFTCNISELRSLSTGLTAESRHNINCDITEKVGAALQTKLDGVSYNAAKIKRSEQIKTLQDLQPGVRLGKKKTLHVDAGILFSRCSAISQRIGEDLESYFQWEMCVAPPSLFKDNLMRKATKSELADALYAGVVEAIPSGERMRVVDGGWLLHYVRWKSMTYQGVFEQYSSYLKTQFGLCIVVFDGYPEISTKDHEHQRRQSDRLPAATIEVNPSRRRYKDQESFFTNIKNKVSFISALTNHLLKDGHVVKQAPADADTVIASTALQYAKHQQPVELIANDTDILVLLLHHWENDMADIYIHKVNGGAKRKLIGPSTIHSVRNVSSNVCPIIKKYILFIHAWSGCDTTSSTFGQGKTNLLKAIVKDRSIQDTVDEFYSADTEATVGKLGNTIFTFLLGENCKGLSLTTIRFHKYQVMIANSSSLEPQRLPPTVRAAHFHSLRVYLQIKQWINLDTEILDPCSWGWKHGHFGLEPIKTDMDIAPESVLKFIRCKCKSQNSNQCRTNLCTCFKHGIKCVEACGGCHGVTCRNTVPIDTQE